MWFGCKWDNSQTETPHDVEVNYRHSLQQWEIP